MEFSVNDLRRLCNLSDQDLAEYLNLNLDFEDDVKRVEKIKSSLSTFLNSIDEDSLNKLMVFLRWYSK